MKQAANRNRFGAQLVITCEGGYPETFLNEAAAAHIPVWDIRRQEFTLRCRVFASDYRALRPLARKARVRMRVAAKRGLVFWGRHAGMRSSLLVSLAVFAAVLQLLSSRVWVLRIEGNRTVPDQAIYDVLAPLGVRVGTPFSEADLPSLRLTALQQLPSLTWLAVNQQGGILTVSVTERNETPPPETNTPANVVSARDGTVLRINVRTGQAMVKVGDAVRSGDLLISGVTDSRVGAHLKHAQGTVTARTSRTLTVSVPLCEPISVPTHTIVRPTLTVFGLSVPLYTDTTLIGHPEKTSEAHVLTAAGVPLPLGLTVERYHYQSAATLTRTAAEAQAEAERQLQKKQDELYLTFTAEQRTVSQAEKDGCIVLTATYTGTEEIGLSVPIV